MFTVSGATEKHNSFLTCSMSCFAHAINLVVGAFINTLSPKQPSSSDTGEDEYVVPGPVAGQSYNESDVAGEEDDNEMVEVLRQKVKEMEKEPGVKSSTVRASSLLLRIRAFVSKVRDLATSSVSLIILRIGSLVHAGKMLLEDLLQECKSHSPRVDSILQDTLGLLAWRPWLGFGVVKGKQFILRKPPPPKMNTLA